MRGLKQDMLNTDEFDIESHLLQMRGLKLDKEKGKEDAKVASFTDAWIETIVSSLAALSASSRIFYRCVD